MTGISAPAHDRSIVACVSLTGCGGSASTSPSTATGAARPQLRRRSLHLMRCPRRPPVRRRHARLSRGDIVCGRVCCRRDAPTRPRRSRSSRSRPRCRHHDAALQSRPSLPWSHLARTEPRSTASSRASAADRTEPTRPPSVRRNAVGGGSSRSKVASGSTTGVLAAGDPGRRTVDPTPVRRQEGQRRGEDVTAVIGRPGERRRRVTLATAWSSGSTPRDEAYVAAYLADALLPWTHDRFGDAVDPVTRRLRRRGSIGSSAMRCAALSPRPGFGAPAWCAAPDIILATAGPSTRATDVPPRLR